MPSDVKQYGVGVIGAGPFSHHILERLLLREDLTLVAGWFGNQSSGPNPRTCEVQSQPRAVIDHPGTQIIYFADPPSLDLVKHAIQCGKAVVLTSTIGLNSSDLYRMADLAASSGKIAVLDEPRRWDADFLDAKAAFDAGHFGRLQRVRLSIHETALPGETFSTGVLRELGYHWFDQLLVFATADPEAVHLREFGSVAGAGNVGFLATIDFSDQLSAVVEVQTASVLSLRTGWLLEGTAGAYRAGRLYSKTPDGEIVDEPVTLPARNTDPFLDNLVKSMARDGAAASLFATLAHAARTMALIELLYKSVPRLSGS